MNEFVELYSNNSLFHTGVEGLQVSELKKVSGKEGECLDGRGGGGGGGGGGGEIREMCWEND